MMTIRRMVLLIGLAWLLTGCISQQSETTLRTDGSGTHEIRIGLSQQLIDLANMGGQGSVDIDDALAELGGSVDDLPAEWGATSEPWHSDDGEFQGSRIQLQFRDLAMLEDQLQGDILGAGNSVLVWSNVQVREENGAFVVQATVAAPDSAASSDTDDLTALLGNSGLGGSAPKMTWRIALPGEITQWSEQDIGALDADNNNVVTYTFPYPPTRAYTIEVHGKTKAGIAPQTVLIVGGLLVFGLALITTGVIVNRRNRRRRPASPTAPLTAPHQPMSYTAPAPRKDDPPAPPVVPPPVRSDDSPRIPTRVLGSWMDNDKNRKDEGESRQDT